MRKVMNILIAGLLLIGAVEAQAVDYKNSYQRQQTSGHGVVVSVQSTTPSTSFQSTSGLVGSGSAYSANPTIGADGAAVYSAADEGGTKRPPGHIRKDGFDGGSLPDNPNEPATPLGDAAMPLLLMAGIYLLLRFARNRILDR